MVEASLEILATEGPENGLTVHAIVDKAGSSVGSFYARFKGKDDVLEYLGERVSAARTYSWHASSAQLLYVDSTQVNWL